MRLKIQEQSELNFVSRIIQWPLVIGNCPASAGARRRLRRRIIDAWPSGYTLRKPTTPASAGAGCANKVSRRPEAHPAGERIVNDILPYRQVTACKVVTYKRVCIRLKKSFRSHRHDRRLDYSCRLMRKNNHERYLSIGHNFIVGIIEALRLGKF